MVPTNDLKCTAHIYEMCAYFLNVSQKCALSVREMLDSATKELVEKGFTDANDANALGSRATDGKKTRLKSVPWRKNFCTN